MSEVLETTAEGLIGLVIMCVATRGPHTATTRGPTDHNTVNETCAITQAQTMIYYFIF